MPPRYDATDELSGAEYLASIYGTEKGCCFVSDCLNAIGACRHGDSCYRTHHKPTFSNTVLLKNFYHSPVVDPRQADAFEQVGKRNEIEQQYFDEFYEEVFTECDTKYGPIDELVVSENIGEHMVGNVYIKFVNEEDAEKCVQGLDNRWFNGNAIYAELSPVADFREARCRQHEISTCVKGGFCNFMHVKPVSEEVMDRLFANRRRSGRRRRSRSRDRDDDKDRRRRY